LVEGRDPTFFITANTHYAMLTWKNPELMAVNRAARFIIADGAPLVWASRGTPTPLPERVAGSDLIFELSELAARKNYRVFLAGGAPGVATEAASRLVARYPGLQVVGTASPSFRGPLDRDYLELRARIHETKPHILMIAATMPHGERWLAAQAVDLGVPVSVNLGASFDFAAARVTRAPRWMQRTGLEWAFRLSIEPRRLAFRYIRNALFIARMLLQRRGVARTVMNSPVGVGRDDLES
jgi:N-acetylglucosaminyldiphosphoundecaprenol N-acetyl-beta-D-mannosaminyltransferase